MNGLRTAVEMTDKPNHIAALAAAVLGVLAAWGARWLMSPVVGDGLPFITFFPVVFVLALITAYRLRQWDRPVIPQDAPT